MSDEIKIQMSSKYDDFQLIHTNRDLNPKHVQNLKEIMLEEGNFLQHNPILVNERMEIIDGQHRFTAAKEAEMPVYYIQREGLTMHNAVMMNILQRNWTTDDYARHYADRGDIQYRRYLDIKEEFGVSHSLMMGAIYGDTKGKFADFKRGDLSIGDEENVTKVRERLEKGQAIMHEAGLNHQAFAEAAMRVIDIPGFDLRRMQNKIKLHGPGYLKRYSVVQDNLRMLEDIYNHGNSESNRLRLY